MTLTDTTLFEKEQSILKLIDAKLLDHNLYTPFLLCREIINQVGNLTNKNILVLYTYELTYLLVKEYKCDPVNITLVGQATNKVKTTLAQKLGINYCDESQFFSIGSIMNKKFDVIVGNPPYSKDTKAKRWTLWEEFVKKSMTLADTVAMVVPQSLTSPGNTWGLVNSHCSVINVDVSKHFNVGSTFCYFIATPNQEQPATKIITENNQYDIDIRKLPFLPANINDTTIEQLNHLMSRKSRKWRRGELHTSNKNLFNDNGKYTVMHTNAQTLHTDVSHPNLTKIRVGVTLSGYPTFKVVTNGYMSQACFWTEFDNIADAQAFANECNDSEVQELLTNFKWSGWNSKEVIECL